MIDNLNSYLMQFPENQRLNRLREYIQWLILRSLDERTYRRNLGFVGGTALRVVYKTPRFSEDIDFSLISGSQLDVMELAPTLKKDMERCNLETVIARINNNTNVASFFLKFANLLYTLGISPNKNQLLSIKVEVDTNPPQGWKTDDYLFADPIMFWVTHHDLPSLFAGKIHAFLFRSYEKGRDFHDLIFFLKKKSPVNLTLFKNAARQTNPEKEYGSSKEVFLEVAAKTEKIDMGKIRKDIKPFLLEPDEERFITPETILSLLEQGGYLV